MKSGLEGRNNERGRRGSIPEGAVTMKSGLEGRTNQLGESVSAPGLNRLNEVRPRRREQ